jgi:hypothetical protein
LAPAFDVGAESALPKVYLLAVNRRMVSHHRLITASIGD